MNGTLIRMVFNNNIIFLLIITLSIINSVVQSKRSRFYVRGQIDCHGMRPKKIHVGLYQKTIFQDYLLLKEVLSYCNEYFQVYGTETIISARNHYLLWKKSYRFFPVVVFSFKYRIENLVCEVRAVFSLPNNHSSILSQYDKFYNLNVVDLTKPNYQEKKCYLKRKWSSHRKKSYSTMDRSRLSTKF
uniref:Uncharacterized protein n=1 Tax=Strongyloides venezuelensis TaxID=75913 RepID=A0A0K0FJY4_STRVS